MVPSMFLAGDRDPAIHSPGMSRLIQRLPYSSMPNLAKTVLIGDCGHWVQQERADQVNGFLLEFLDGLPDVR